MEEEQENKAKKGALAAVFDGASSRELRAGGNWRSPACTPRQNPPGPTAGAGEGNTLGAIMNSIGPRPEGLSFAFGFRPAQGEAKPPGEDQQDGHEKTKKKKSGKKSKSVSQTMGVPGSQGSDTVIELSDFASHGEGRPSGSRAPCVLASVQSSRPGRGKKRKLEATPLERQRTGKVH